MNNANPYLPPEASLADERTEQGEILAATRRQWLGASVLDAVIAIALMFPVALGMLEYANQGLVAPFLYLLGMSTLGFLLFALVHGYFLKRNSQTIGKKIVDLIAGTKVVQAKKRA